MKREGPRLSAWWVLTASRELRTRKAVMPSISFSRPWPWRLLVPPAHNLASSPLAFTCLVCPPVTCFTGTASVCPTPLLPGTWQPSAPSAWLSPLLAISSLRATPSLPCSLYSIGVLIKLCFGGKKQTGPQFTSRRRPKTKIRSAFIRGLPFRQGGLLHRQGAVVCKGRFWG